MWLVDSYQEAKTEEKLPNKGKNTKIKKILEKVHEIVAAKLKIALMSKNGEKLCRHYQMIFKFQ